MFEKRKLSAGSVAVRLAALRFFYCKTLKKGWSIADTPYPKKDHRLPAILSQEEVAQLIDAASTLFHRTLLMTLYATGARNAELTRLKFSDVESKRMVIHIQGGKGRKDRDVMLSPKLLEELREHWQRLRRKPRVWLFPGNHDHCADRYENRLACVPASRPTSGPPEKCSSSHASSLGNRLTSLGRGFESHNNDGELDRRFAAC